MPSSAATSAAMHQAAAQAQVVVRNLGPEKVASIVGGLLGLLGAVLPFYSIPNMGGGVLDTGDADTTATVPALPTLSLVNGGSLGVIVILLAIVLAAGPFINTTSRAMAVAGFGLSAAVLGMLLSDRLGFSFLGQSVVPDFGIGWYLGLLGFALLAWVYGKRCFH